MALRGGWVMLTLKVLGLRIIGRPPRMSYSYSEFREVLARTARSWDTVGGRVRIENPHGGRPRCPLTEVAWVATDRCFPMALANLAGWCLGIPFRQACRIMDAADGTDDCDRAIRRDLLLDTGLLAPNAGLTEEPAPPSAGSGQDAPSRDAMDEALAAPTLGSQVPPPDEPRSHPARPIPEPELVEV